MPIVGDLTDRNSIALAHHDLRSFNAMLDELRPQDADVDDDAAFLIPGARFGRYTLVRRLAIGGMAEIHLARASGLSGFEKLVVLKRILPQFAVMEDFVEMFLDE